MDSYSTLVIILAVALAVFLVLAILLTIQLIKISRNVRSVTQRAEDVSETMAAVARYIKPATISAAIVKLFKKQLLCLIFGRLS